MSSGTKAAALAALAGSAAAFSGLAPAGLKPAGAKLGNARLALRNARPAKVCSSPRLRTWCDEPRQRLRSAGADVLLCMVRRHRTGAWW